MGRQSSLPQGRIRVTAKNGSIYLKGEVDAECQKIAAEKSVECLTGVLGVMKQVEIGPKASAPKVGPRSQAVSMTADY